MPRQKQERNVALARKLRSGMSLPEVMLWQRLRQSDEAKFRRQHPLGRYVLDFYCASARLCIEVDGISHGMGAQPLRDLERDAWLAGQGVRVVRVPAAEVLQDVDGIAEAVMRLCRGS